MEPQSILELQDLRGGENQACSTPCDTRGSIHINLPWGLVSQRRVLLGRKGAFHDEIRQRLCLDGRPWMVTNVKLA